MWLWLLLILGLLHREQQTVRKETRVKELSVGETRREKRGDDEPWCFES